MSVGDQPVTIGQGFFVVFFFGALFASVLFLRTTCDDVKSATSARPGEPATAAATLALSATECFAYHNSPTGRSMTHVPMFATEALLIAVINEKDDKMRELRISVAHAVEMNAKMRILQHKPGGILQVTAPHGVTGWLDTEWCQASPAKPSAAP